HVAGATPRRTITDTGVCSMYSSIVLSPTYLTCTCHLGCKPPLGPILGQVLKCRRCRNRERLQTLVTPRGLVGRVLAKLCSPMPGGFGTLRVYFHVAIAPMPLA